MSKRVPIVLVTYRRPHFLKYVVKKIYERTNYPYQLLVVNNDRNDDEAIRYLKQAKSWGYVHEFLNAPENKGLAKGIAIGYQWFKDKKNSSEYFVATQDDIVPPLLKPCWLERMVHLIKKYPEYKAICTRVQRTRRRDLNDFEDIVPNDPSCTSTLRIAEKKTLEEIGFNTRPHWESSEFSKRMKEKGYKMGLTSWIYSDHIGFVENKGFEKGFKNYHTFAENRQTQHLDQPYPVIDEKTNIPLKMNTPRDRHEHKERTDYWNYWGLDSHRTTHKTEDQKILEEYGKEGKGIEIGPGKVKCNKNAMGIDIYPYSTADILGNGNDLWMFKDGELDFIIASHNLEYYPDVKTTLREWERVLRQGGIIAVAVPDSEKAPQVIRDPHKIAFTKQILKIIFEHDIKMKVIRVEDVPNKKRGHESFIVVAQKK